MTLEQPQNDSSDCGIYRKKQLLRLKELYAKLNRYFNEAFLKTRTRKQLRDLIISARSDLKLMPED